MLLSGLNAIDFSKLRLDGLSGYTSISMDQAKQIAWDHTPMGTSAVISEADFKSKVASMYNDGYVLIKTTSSSGLNVMDTASAAAEAKAQGRERGGAEKMYLGRWMSNLADDGYYFLIPSKPSRSMPSPSGNADPVSQSASTSSVSVSMSLPPSQQTPDNVVKDATTASANKKPTPIETFSAAMDMVKTLAPLMTAQKQTAAANELLKQAKAGKKIYKKDTSIVPWLVLGVGVVSVIGLGIYFATREH